MVYGRCLYHILIRADLKQRLLYNLSRGDILKYIQHACVIQRCELVRAYIGVGYVSFLVELDAHLSISAFIFNLKSSTSSWVTGIDGQHDYWEEKHQMCQISPEDRGVIATNIATNPEFFPLFKLSLVYHHIIMLTSRCRLLIPIKYRVLMSNLITDVAQSLGAKTIACASMRNHVHLLCGVPTDVSISQFIDNLRLVLTDRMLANRHLRRIEAWSDIAIAFTVSTDKISQEEHQILDQDFIHSHTHYVNEMSPLYQRLDILYVVSLH